MSTRIELPALLTPGDAVMLRNSLLAALATSGRIEVDASAVQNLSVQGVQVLLSFVASATAIAHPWVLKAPSEDLVAQLESYGLFPQLMTWPVEV